MLASVIVDVYIVYEAYHEGISTGEISMKISGVVEGRLIYL